MERGSTIYRVVRLAPAILWMVIIFGLSSLSAVPQAPSLSAELTAIAGHIIAYAILSLLMFFGLGIVSVDTFRRSLLAVILSVLYGASDEIHQSFVPGRDASAFDVMTDATGAVLGLWMLYVIVRMRDQRRAET